MSPTNRCVRCGLKGTPEDGVRYDQENKEWKCVPFTPEQLNELEQLAQSGTASPKTVIALISEIRRLKAITDKFEDFIYQCEDQNVFLPAEVDDLMDAIRKESDCQKNM